MNKPLNGIKVLDFSMFLSGPRASQILADFGAEVVKVEPPSGETMRMWLKLIPNHEEAMNNWHRNKKGISIDTGTPEGVDLVKRLIPHFDILIENLTPGKMDNCGLGYEELTKIHPGLIYCSISGFGRDSHLYHRVAFDIIAQATGGIMAAQRTEHQSPGVYFGDLVSGSYAATGIMMALRHRDQTGEGQLIDISMQDVMYFHNYRAFQVRMHKDHESIREALGSTHEELFDDEEGMPFWRTYQCRDGYVAVVFLTDRQFGAMCDIMGKPGFKDDPRFDSLISRVKNREFLRKAVDDWMKGKSAKEVEKILDEHKIPCGRVLSLKEVNEDANLKARGMVTELEAAHGHRVPVPGIPIKLSASPGTIEHRAPDIGEHNAEVFGQYLGLTEDQVRALKEKGII